MKYADRIALLMVIILFTYTGLSMVSFWFQKHAEVWQAEELYVIEEQAQMRRQAERQAQSGMKSQSHTCIGVNREGDLIQLDCGAGQEPQQ